MAPVPIALATRSNPSRHGVEGAARLINCYAEELGEEGKSSFAAYSIAGLVEYATLGGSGGVRALLTVDDLLYCVHGRSMSRVYQSGSSTIIGGMPSDGLVTMARNRRENPEVGVVSDGQYWIATRTGFDRAAVSALPPPNSICEIDGYFVFTIQDGRVFVSDLNNGTVVDALSQAKAESSADGLVRGFVRNRDLMLMGSRSIEYWTDTGGDPFPFTRSTSIDIGCLCAGSVASVLITKGGSMVDGVAWVATNKQGDYAGVVLLSGGYQPAKISTYQADRDIGSDPRPSAIRGFSWIENGHSFYALRGTGYTWVFDATTGLPHERRSHGSATWRPSCSEAFGGVVLGDADAGRIYKISPSALTEAGNPIVSVCQCPVTHANPKRLRWNALSVDAVPSVVDIGTPGAVRPHVMVDWSHDGGRTWSAQTIGDATVVGNRVERIRPIRRLGVSPPSGRTLRLSWQASDIRGLLSATADVDKLEG